MTTEQKTPVDYLPKDILFFQRENNRLQGEIGNLQGENNCLQEEMRYLQEQLDWFKRQLFGPRSERIVEGLNSEQLYFEGFEKWEKPDQEEKETVPAYKRKKAKRKGADKISIPDNLPVERIVLDIPEKEKICPKTGRLLVKIGEEITHKLAHKPGSFYIKEIVRPKYALPKGEGISVAELPESFLPKCRADESLLAEIVTRKFADHLPLYRISEILNRDRIYISRQLLSQWIVGIGMGLKPLYNEMCKMVLQSGNIFVDESEVALQDPGKGKVHKAYMWVIVGGKGSDPPYRVYHFRKNRQYHNAKELLGKYQGRMHSDKYGAYKELAHYKNIVWCPCWNHIRRKFFEAESGDLKFRKWVLRQIWYLFTLERIAWSRSPEERLYIRQEKESPVIDKLTEKIKERLVKGKILPKSKFREALGYYCGLIPYLKNYTLHSDARLDNNVAERAIRPLALGRKNWLFVGSEKGGEAAAVILSFVQSCRALKINPREYMEDILRRLMSHNSQKLHELLPDNWAKNR